MFLPQCLVLRWMQTCVIAILLVLLRVVTIIIIIFSYWWLLCNKHWHYLSLLDWLQARLDWLQALLPGDVD